MKEKEKFLVLGSNSFSASSFIAYVLKENPKAEIIGVSRSGEYKDCFLPYKKINDGRFQFYQLDLNKHLEQIISLVQKNSPHYIVNFAAQGMVEQSWDAPQQWFKTNCLAILNLANRLSGEKYLKRYVQISTPEVYGSCNNAKEESALLSPSTPYAASKACGDLSLYPLFLNKGLPLVYTRAVNVYGPCQQLYRIIPRSFVSIKKGIKIPLQGGGVVIRSYLHIRDVCDATLRAARFGRNGEVYHISPEGNGIRIYDLIEMICKKMDRKIKDCIEVVQERLGQDAAYLLDSSKIRKELGWKQGIDLDNGLSEVLDWVESNWQYLKNEPMEYIHKP